VQAAEAKLARVGTAVRTERLKREQAAAALRSAKEEEEAAAAAARARAEEAEATGADPNPTESEETATTSVSAQRRSFAEQVEQLQETWDEYNSRDVRFRCFTPGPDDSVSSDEDEEVAAAQERGAARTYEAETERDREPGSPTAAAVAGATERGEMLDVVAYDTAARNTVRRLSENPSTLDLSYGKIGVRGAIAAAERLLKSSSVTVLLLANNPVGDHGFRAIAHALRHGGGVKELDVRATGITWQSAGELANQLCKLTSLRLAGNKLGDKGASLLADKLPSAKVLTLDASDCAFGPAGVSRLAEAVANNIKLKTLDVSRNTTNARAIAALTAALQNSPSVTHADLSHLGLGDHPGLLADMLRDAPALTHLSLAGNGLRADFAQALVAALAENEHKISVLDLSYNPLGRTGVRTLLAAKLRGDTERLVLRGVSLVDLHDTGRVAPAELRADEVLQSGFYKLDLAVAAERAVALRLVGLHQEKGPRAWERSSYEGAQFTLSAEMGWPAKLPAKGALAVQYKALAKQRSEREPLPQEHFQTLWRDIRETSSAGEKWDLALARTLVSLDLPLCASQVRRASGRRRIHTIRSPLLGT